MNQSDLPYLDFVIRSVFCCVRVLPRYEVHVILNMHEAYLYKMPQKFLAIDS